MNLLKSTTIFIYFAYFVNFMIGGFYVKVSNE